MNKEKFFSEGGDKSKEKWEPDEKTKNSYWYKYIHLSYDEMLEVKKEEETLEQKIFIKKTGINFRLHYIVEEAPYNHILKKGDYFISERYKRTYVSTSDRYYNYSIIYPVRGEGSTFIGMKQKNSSKLFETINELNEFLKGVKLVPDKKWATDRINNLNEEILQIKKDYNI